MFDNLEGMRWTKIALVIDIVLWKAEILIVKVQKCLHRQIMLWNFAVRQILKCDKERPI